MILVLGYFAPDFIRSFSFLIKIQKRGYFMRNKDIYVIRATEKHANFVCDVYEENREALHGDSIAFYEWESILLPIDPDEINFLACLDGVAMAWFRVNGLLNSDAAWLSMLVVAKKYQRQGVGRFAVGYAERLAKERGFPELRIHTHRDNIPARACYTSLGYQAFSYDGTDPDGICFKKML